MSLESLRLVSRLAGSDRAPNGVLYADAWPGRWQGLGQRLYQAGLWLDCLLWRKTALLLRGPGLPAAKGPVEPGPLAPPWTWSRPVVILPGGDWARLVAGLGLDAEPAPDVLLADNGVVVALGHAGGIPAVVHACTDEDRLARYAARADSARQALSAGGLAHLVPTVFGVSRSNGYARLAQQRMAGGVARVKGMSSVELEALVAVALRPLAALAEVGRVPSAGADGPWIDDVCRSLAKVDDWTPWLKAPLAALPRLRVRYQAPAVFVHGDYWLSNVLLAPDGSSIWAILDWERARPAGLAGLDALHLVVFAFATWRGCSPMQVTTMIWDDLCEPTLEHLLEAAQEAVGLSRQQMAEVAIAFWLGHLRLHHADRLNWPATRVADWVVEPARAAARWLSTHGLDADR